MSQKIGISRTAYQELDFVMSQSGASVDSLKTGMKTLTDQMSMAQDGSETAMSAFDDLGVSWKDGNGNLKDQETMMFEAMSALQDMEDQTKKAALANDLFGKAGTEMMPMLNGAAGSIDDMRKQAHELGLVLTDETVNSGVLFTDTMDKAKRSLGAVAVGIGAEVMPMVQSFLEWVMQHMPEIQATMQTVFDVISGAVSLTSDAIQALTGFFIEHWAVIEPILIGLGAGAAAFGIYTLAINATSIAMGVATAAGTAFGAVLTFITSPVGIVVVAIGALVAAGVALYKNWDKVKEFLGKTWDWIKNTAMSVFNSVSDFFSKFSDKVKGIFTGIKDVVTEIWDGIVDGIKSGINFILKGINAFIKGVNKIKVPDWVPGVGGKGINIPEIPMLAEGGEIEKAGRVLVGEQGPEFLDLPKGARVTPLEKANNENTVNVNATLRIDKFYNNDELDVENLMEQFAFFTKRKMEGSGLVFAK